MGKSQSTLEDEVQVMRLTSNAYRALMTYRYLPALGASIFILSLGFDAYAQQVLNAEVQIVPDPELVTNIGSQSILPRATAYTDALSPAFPGLNQNGDEYSKRRSPIFLANLT